MANANIATIAVTNTFDEWRTRTNDLIVDRNTLRNQSYVKDNSNFTIANGALTIARATGGTLLTITGGGDALIGGTTTTTNLFVGSDGFVANQLTVGSATSPRRGNTIIYGNVAISSNTVISQNANVTGTLNVGSGLDVLGNARLNADANVAGTLNVVSRLDVAGNTNIFSNVAITNNATIAQNVTITGTLNSGDATITSARVTSNAAILTTLDVGGNTALSANLAVSNNVAVAQNATVTGTLNTGAATLASLSVTGTANVGTTLGVAGATTLSSTLNVVGNAIVSANLNVSSNLTVSGRNLSYNIRNDATETFWMDRGNASFNNVTITGNLAIAQPATTTSDRIILNELPSLARDGYFIVRRGAANANATLRFSESTGVWRAGGTDTVSTILLVSNLSSSVANTSTTDAATPSAVKTAYDTAVNAYGQANSAFSTANNRVSSVSGTSGRITSSGGLTPTIDLATTGAGAASYSSGISALTVDAYGRVTAVTGSAAYITTDGRAYPRRSDGTHINFEYNGQSGQPTWLWGTNDGVTMRVWNPSNFSVSFSSSSGNADTVDGFHAAAFAQLAGATFTGSIFAPAFFYSSDRRHKENIETIDNALNKVTSLRGVSYNFKKDADKRKQIGVIAQEIRQFVPEAVVDDGDQGMSVAYGNMVGLLIEAIKELKTELDSVKRELNEIKKV